MEIDGFCLRSFFRNYEVIDVVRQGFLFKMRGVEELEILVGRGEFDIYIRWWVWGIFIGSVIKRLYERVEGIR